MAAGIPIYQFINNQYSVASKTNTVVAKIPSPIFNMINGGKHGSTNLDFQEFHVIPPTSISFAKALELGGDVYSTLKKILDYRNASIAVSEEGGFTPNLLSNIDALELLKEAISQRKLKLGIDVFIGLDCAANHYYKNGKYLIKDKPQPVTKEEYIQFLLERVGEYNILILEDPLEEEDFDGWKKITEGIGSKTYIVADDFATGDNQLVKKALEQSACNAVIVKFNQVATITELLELTHILKQKNTKIVFSQRLGETTDSIIADIAVGIGADFVKFGSPVRGERVVKYNRLLEIDQELLSAKA
jgi:enolase